MAKKTEKEMFWQKKFELVISENGKFQKRTQQLETELAEAKTELAELKSLFDLQHKRSLEAMKMWQDAHNEPRTWPDLGKLLEWLMSFVKICDNCKHGENGVCYSPDRPMNMGIECKGMFWERKKQ